MKTLHITTQTADKLRRAAPALGLTLSDRREIVAPGIEALHLTDAEAMALETRRKAAKVSAEVMISRIAGKLGA